MNLLKALQKESISSETDKVIWKGVKGGCFVVKEAFKVLELRLGCPFPEKGIWVPCAPIKTTFYACETIRGKVLTLDKLLGRDWQLLNGCYLCGCAKETIHHILLHCTTMSALSEIIFNLVAVVGVHWVFPKTVKEARICWKGSFVGWKRKKGLENYSALYFLVYLERKESYSF